jgi:hypothetical protein
MIFLNNLNKIFMSKDYPDGQGVSASASASVSDSEGSYDDSSSDSVVDKNDSSVISGKVVRPAPSRERNPLIVEELREDNAEYRKLFNNAPEFEIGVSSAFNKVVPKSEREEVKQRVASDSSKSSDASNIKAVQKRKKSESPANHDGNPDPVDGFNAVRSRSSNDTKKGGVGPGFSNGAGSSNGNGARGELKNSVVAPVVRSSEVLVNKSTQTTPYQGNSPTGKLVPAPAPSSPGRVGVGEEKNGLSPS